MAASPRRRCSIRFRFLLPVRTCPTHGTVSPHYSLADPHGWLLETLFGCFNDLSSCLYGFFCLPCLFGSNAEKIDGTNCIGMCCAYLVLSQCYLCGVPHYITRKKLREKYNLKEDEDCADILTVIFCSPCGICQEARELKFRGIVSRRH